MDEEHNEMSTGNSAYELAARIVDKEVQPVSVVAFEAEVANGKGNWKERCLRETHGIDMAVQPWVIAFAAEVKGAAAKMNWLSVSHCS